jgi:uncharacterized protein YlxW (UPF0749 family)
VVDVPKKTILQKENKIISNTLTTLVASANNESYVSVVPLVVLGVGAAVWQRARIKNFFKAVYSKTIEWPPWIKFSENTGVLNKSEDYDQFIDRLFKLRKKVSHLREGINEMAMGRRELEWHLKELQEEVKAMVMAIETFVPQESSVGADGSTILSEIRTLQERITNMALNLEALTAEVARVKTVSESAKTLIQKIAADLAANANDPNAVAALAADLKASTDALASAVAEGTGATVTVVLNAESTTEPTVEVVLPEVLPEVVTVSTEVAPGPLDVASEEPQVTITVEAAPAEVVAAVEAATEADVANPTVDLPVEGSDPISTEVIETDKGLVDVVVTTDAAEAVAVEAATGVDVLEAVAEAFEASPEVTAAPEA